MKIQTQETFTLKKKKKLIHHSYPNFLLVHSIVCCFCLLQFFGGGYI